MRRGNEYSNTTDPRRRIVKSVVRRELTVLKRGLREFSQAENLKVIQIREIRQGDMLCTKGPQICFSNLDDLN